MIIEEILDARDECVMMKITGEKVRFNRLRSLCKKYNEYEDEKVFDRCIDDRPARYGQRLRRARGGHHSFGQRRCAQVLRQQR